MSPVSTATSTPSSPWPRRLLTTAIVLAIVSAYVFLPLKDWLLLLGAELSGRGLAGVLFYTIFYVGYCLLLLPMALMSITAGVAWNMSGFLIALPAATLAASTAFMISRTCFSGRFRTWLLQKPRLHAVEKAVTRKGAPLIALLRLSPVLPFPLLNYVFGLTETRLPKFALATFVGLIPITLSWTYVGMVGRDLVDPSAKVGHLELVMLVVGLLVTFGITFWVGGAAKKALEEEDQSTS